jgi:hypothetical protein
MLWPSLLAPLPAMFTGHLSTCQVDADVADSFYSLNDTCDGLMSRLREQSIGSFLIALRAIPAAFN